MKRALLFLTSILLFSLSAGCNHTRLDLLKTQPSKAEINLYQVRQSFVGIYKTEMLESARVLKSFGSGMTVGKHLVLTAAHVCAGAPTSLVKLMVIDIKGRQFLAEIKKKDVLNDICLVEVNKLPGKAIVVSDEAPFEGQSVWSVAAPYGLWAPGMVPILAGHFAGTTKGKQFYTFRLAPGSSGSAVVNRDGKIVGITTHMTGGFPLALGPTLEQIRTFLTK